MALYHLSEKGYYILSKKEGDYIIKQIQICIDYPWESKPALLGIKEIIVGGFQESLRTCSRKWTEEEREKQSSMMKEYWTKMKNGGQNENNKNI